jgi:hypothetical protein
MFLYNSHEFMKNQNIKLTRKICKCQINFTDFQRLVF